MPMPPVKRGARQAASGKGTEPCQRKVAQAPITVILAVARIATRPVL